MDDQPVAYDNIPAEWARRRAEYLRATRWVWVLFAATAALCSIPFIFDVITGRGAAVLIGALALCIAILIYVRDILHVPCPIENYVSR